MRCLKPNCGHYMVAGVHTEEASKLACDRAVNIGTQPVKIPCYVCPNCGALWYPESEGELQGWIWLYGMQMNSVTDAVLRSMESDAVVAKDESHIK